MVRVLKNIFILFVQTVSLNFLARLFISLSLQVFLGVERMPLIYVYYLIIPSYETFLVLLFLQNYSCSFNLEHLSADRQDLSFNIYYYPTGFT